MSSMSRVSSSPVFHTSNYTSGQTWTDSDPIESIPPLQSDLWEAITGECVPPEKIAAFFSMSFSFPCDGQRTQSVKLSAKARDKQGSRLLQKEIEEGTPMKRKAILESLISEFPVLVYDNYANYVVQKMCGYANEDSQGLLLRFFLSNLNGILDQTNACRALQKFIETASDRDVDQLFIACRDSVYSLSLSSNGNHIVQKFVERLPGRRQELVDCLKPYVSKLVIDNCGCRVIQKMFVTCDRNMLSPLIEEVLQCASMLATDQYGNYVVQNVLGSGSDEDVAVLINGFQGGFYTFTIHKYASNVIEKCIVRANSKQREVIFAELIGTVDHWQYNNIFRIVGDPFGNYVAQRILEYGTEEERAAIWRVVYKHFDELLEKGYARHVISKLTSQGFSFDE